MSCCLQRTNGAPNSGGGGALAAVWTERYLGPVQDAPAVVLNAGVTPTVTIPNATATPGQSSQAIWTSNSLDPVPSAAMGAIAAFGTDGATGLVMNGPSIGNHSFTASANQAPHIWTTWNQLLNEDPRGGEDYCLMVRIASTTMSATQQAVGPGLYKPADGSPPPDLRGSPAPTASKCLRCWREIETNILGAVLREGTSTWRQISGARLPADMDTFGFIMSGSSNCQGLVGTSVDGVLPDPDQMTPIVGDWLGGSQTVGTTTYMDPLERVAVAFQTISSTSYNATVDTIRVLSRGGSV